MLFTFCRIHEILNVSAVQEQTISSFENLVQVLEEKIDSLIVQNMG